MSDDDETPTTGADIARRALQSAQTNVAARRVSAPGRDEQRRRANRAANLRAARSGYTGPGADAWDPQPLGAVLGGLLDQMGWQRPITEARLFTDWAALVGAEVAAHCRPDSFRDGELRIEAESTAWATQLNLLGGKLMFRLNAQLGSTVVRKVHVSGPTGPSWRHGYRSVPGARGPRDTYG